MNLSKHGALQRVSNAVAAGTTVITPSAGVDMQGYDSVLFVVAFGTLTSGAVTSVEAHTSSDDGSTDTYAALADSKVTVADTMSNKLFYLDIHRPPERYVKPIVNRGTANAVVDGIFAIRYNARSHPVSHHSTVGGGEFHAEPLNGTA